MTVLQDEGYAVIAATVPVDAVALLGHVCFDLPISDGFSEAANAAFMHARDGLQRAASSSVALLSVPTLELEQAREVRFRDLIAEPFDIENLLQLVRALHGRRGTDPDPVLCYRTTLRQAIRSGASSVGCQQRPVP